MIVCCCEKGFASFQSSIPILPYLKKRKKEEGEKEEETEEEKKSEEEEEKETEQEVFTSCEL